MEYILNAIRGFCMALADSVPGVSGGTIAFILGFYDKFINSLDDLMYGKKEEKITALKFLIKIGIGWGIGMVLAMLFLTRVFESHIYQVSSLFMGFILLSIPVIIKEEKESLKGKYHNIIFTLIGITIVCLITYFNPIASGNETGVDITNLNIGLGLYMVLAGMVAVSAMVLPGISGSTLLLILGLYFPITTGIREFLHLHLEYFLPLCLFGIGVIAGVLLVIRLIKLALKKARSQTIYCIIGLMIGSFYAIIMGPRTLSVPSDPMNFGTFSILFFVIGGVLIFGLEKLKSVLESKTENK